MAEDNTRETKTVTITRVSLAQEVAKTTDLSNKDAEIIVNEILQSMVDALKQGDEIEIRGFGSFRQRSRAARRGRNPKTGQAVDVAPKKVTYFKLGKDLKSLLSQETK